jgi:hypothetical protein
MLLGSAPVLFCALANDEANRQRILPLSIYVQVCVPTIEEKLSHSTTTCQRAD